MAVVMMITQDKAFEAPGHLKANVRIDWSFHGHEFDHIIHAYNCPNRQKRICNEDCLGHRCGYAGPLFLRTAYKGRVVKTGEINGYHDSDFYAVYFSYDNCGFKEIEYATTRGWTYPNGAKVDAPECIKRLYKEYVAGLKKIAHRKHLQQKESELLQFKEIVNEEHFYRIKELAHTPNWNLISKLILSYHNGQLRNKFRKSLAQQIIKWLTDDAYYMKYRRPLSVKQRQYL